MKNLTSFTYAKYILKFTSLVRDPMFFKIASNFWFHILEDYFRPYKDL
jgi:hypothetical protein